MERCTGHTIKVYGNSNRPYKVSIENGLPSCTCMSFVMNRNRSKNKDFNEIYDKHDAPIAWCKHIEAQFDRLCGWQGVSVIIPGLCPRCSQPTEVIEDE